MKNNILFIAILLFLFLIAISFIDTADKIIGDINSHSWDSIIGRWHCKEMKYLELEIYPNGTYNKYYYNKLIVTGKLIINGNNITINDSFDNCAAKGSDKCMETLNYQMIYDELILNNNSNELSFIRVDSIFDK
jgi:hypothetical protein